jgi:sec-independent protein translocase protein TatC
MKQSPRAQQTSINHKPTAKATQQTLIGHLHELRSRLFWLVLLMLAASSASYLIKDQIMAALMAPLGGQQLVYLTPIGGFNFIFKVSLYFGIGLILPAIVYHLYRFLEPIMESRRKKSVILFCVASFFLTIGGGCFAYFGSLPAALHFLTSFDIHNVSAMLTVDSYLSFVVTYVLGFAALFQIPLILMIVNMIKPIPPKKLLGVERYVVLVAFILAAIISPTPDITNQAILAVPIILMYQVGVLCVWFQSRAALRHSRQLSPVSKTSSPVPKPVIRHEPVKPEPARYPAVSVASTSAPSLQPQPVRRSRPVMDISAPRSTRNAAVSRSTRPLPDLVRTPSPCHRVQPRPLSRVASIDGFAPRSRQIPQTG